MSLSRFKGLYYFSLYFVYTEHNLNELVFDHISTTCDHICTAVRPGSVLGLEHWSVSGSLSCHMQSAVRTSYCTETGQNRGQWGPAAHINTRAPCQVMLAMFIKP